MTLPISTAHARELARLREHDARPEFVLIGAAALGHHVPLHRKTNDVDLALVVSPGDIEALLRSLGWAPDPRMEPRWHGPEAFRADVLPATPELISAGTLELDGATKAMSLIGFDLAFQHASEVELPGRTSSVKVASLASIVVLKIVAWLDRPHERSRDLGDLATVFTNALGADDDRRWDESHPVSSNGLEFDDQSPFCVGLEVGTIVRDRHRVKIDEFVDRLLGESGADAAVMARAAGLAGEAAHLRAQRLVEVFAEGLRHERARTRDALDR